MTVVPITLREANDFVESFHRHNGRTARDGGKFALGLETDELVGVAIVGNPLSATLMQRGVAEVLRVCVNKNAPKNSCSKLYGACWRVWRAMGGHKLLTYTLQSESGASLKGAGFSVVGETSPHSGWGRNRKKDNRTREWQPIYGQLKFRWERV